ncbi:MAG: Crp/Fnr family transcriptional regulator [Flavobacteriales bacterium]|nr:MAG: Crp/Fnr family transcriptional regulator [Flavobacteriales bacterium]
MSGCEQCLIREFGSLRALKPEELKAMSDEKDIVSFGKGDVIFEEGQILKGVYCLKEGACKMSRLNANGKEQIVKFLKKGDMLGYRSVLSEEPTTLTVTALQDLQACFIPKKEIFYAIEHNPKFSMDMMRTVCSDLRDANMAVSNMAQKNVKQRLADAIIFLKETFGEKDNYINISLTREELASIVGTATESAIRILSEFKKEKLLDIKGKQLSILDEAGLLRLAKGF